MNLDAGLFWSGFLRTKAIDEAALMDRDFAADHWLKLVPWTYAEDFTFCYIHCEVEVIPADAYIVCFECSHVYKTAAELEWAYVEAVGEMHNSPQIPMPTVDSILKAHDPDWVPPEPLAGPPEPRSADEIYFCQECIHDF